MGSAWGAESPKLHHENDGRRNRDGRHRVHHDAELAVIGVGCVRVLVGDLGYGQQRKRTRHSTATAGKSHARRRVSRGNMP